MQIVIPFAQVDALNPNLPEANLNESIAKYFRCIAVACYSFRFHNPMVRIIVVTNYDIEKNFQEILESLNIEIEILPFTYNPPIEFGQNFRGCFYIFDALENLKDDSLIIDPDVICLENLDQFFEKISDKISVFKPGFSANKIINGISPNMASEIYSQYTNQSHFHPAEHIGGEAIYIPKKSMDKFAKEISDFWKWNIRRAMESLPYLTTEEHIFTVLLRDTEHDSLSPYISRIWTSRKYKEIEGAVQDINKLALWHLPSEKNRGFQSLFNSLFTNNSKKIWTDFHKAQVSKVMHLNVNVLNRIIYKLVRKF